MTIEMDESTKRDITQNSNTYSSEIDSGESETKSENYSKFDINQSLHQFFLFQRGSQVPPHL
jgi:hypothetical protein